MDKILLVENICRRKTLKCSEFFFWLQLSFKMLLEVRILSVFLARLCAFDPFSSGPVIFRDLDKASSPFLLQALSKPKGLIVLLLIYLALDSTLQVGFGSGFSCLISLFNLTNSLATSSLFLWERIRRIVQPVSFIWIRLPNDSQQAQEPCSMMSFNCITATPTNLSSRAK